MYSSKVGLLKHRVGERRADNESKWGRVMVNVVSSPVMNIYSWNEKSVGVKKRLVVAWG